MEIDSCSIRVKLIEETCLNGYQTKLFSLMSLLSDNDDCSVIVRLVFCPSWPHHCSPLHTATDLVRVVQRIAKQDMQEKVSIAELSKI